MISNGGVSLDVATGFRPVDSEHHLQLDLLHAFRQAVVDERAGADLEELLQKLIDFTKLHFSSEQSLMRLYNYPDMDGHVRDHETAVEILTSMQTAWREGSRARTLSALDEVHDLLINHIQGLDRVLGRYLVRLGVGV